MITPMEKTEENKALLQKLRKTFKTGGTLKNNCIELRYSRIEEVIKFFKDEGYKVQVD